MNSPNYSIGQAVYSRTDVPDYAEVTVVFKTLDELIAICSTPTPGRVLEKVILQGMEGDTPLAVTLAFLSASRGLRRPEDETAKKSGTVASHQ